MNDAATGCHPLYAATFEIALIAQMILVAHMTIQDISHRLESPVRV